MRKTTLIGALIAVLLGTASLATARQSWRPIHQRYVADCRVFTYKPAPLIVANGPSDGEWFTIAAIACTRSAWPHIGLKVCEQQRNMGNWRTVHCQRARRPNVGTPDYLTTDSGSFIAQPFRWYREKLQVRVRHMTRTLYGPENSL